MHLIIIKNMNMKCQQTHWNSHPPIKLVQLKIISFHNFLCIKPSMYLHELNHLSWGLRLSSAFVSYQVLKEFLVFAWVYLVIHGECLIFLAVFLWLFASLMIGLLNKVWSNSWSCLLSSIKKHTYFSTFLFENKDNFFISINPIMLLN